MSEPNPPGFNLMMAFLIGLFVVLLILACVIYLAVIR